MSSDQRRLFRSKKTAADVLPNIGELADGGVVALSWIDLDGEPRHADLSHLVQRDPWPIPRSVDREGYGADEHSVRYWAGGHGDLLNLSSALDRHGPDRPGRVRMLDFGCASGRVLRHVYRFASDRIDAWGCDFAPANVEWLRTHLGSDHKVFVNADIPHLPFPDGHFDLITAFSVFTHIDQLSDMWLLELRRITAPDGLLYITMTNEASWRMLTVNPARQRHFMRAQSWTEGAEPTPELFERPMPLPRIVYRMTDSDVYNLNVWLSDEHVRTNWGRFFEVIDIAPNAHLEFQSVALLRPRHD